MKNCRPPASPTHAALAGLLLQGLAALHDGPAPGRQLRQRAWEGETTETQGLTLGSSQTMGGTPSFWNPEMPPKCERRPSGWGRLPSISQAQNIIFF